MTSLRVLMGENLVWDVGVRVGSHHYARCMTEMWNAAVLWIALPWTPFHLFSRGEAAQARRRAWHFGRGTKPLSNLTVLSPLSLLQYRNMPFLRRPVIARWALAATLPPLKRQSQRMGFSAPDVLWVSDPR